MATRAFYMQKPNQIAMASLNTRTARSSKANINNSNFTGQKQNVTNLVSTQQRGFRSRASDAPIYSR